MSHTVSIIIIVKDRRSHLLNTLKGLFDNQQVHETIVVHMNEEIACSPFNFKGKFISKKLSSTTSLPLARARNYGASLASGDQLIFLDVDCIPSSNLISDYKNMYSIRPDSIYMGEVYYLDKAFPKVWNSNSLNVHGKIHKLRRYLRDKKFEKTNKYELFWSLNFSISKDTYENKLGGFDISFTGYGAEDTDFAFSARKLDIPLFWIKGAKVYHQFHESCSPPLNHLEDIVNNATKFQLKWRQWPMEGWLKEFQSMGLINVHENSIDIVKYPSKEQVNSCLN